MLMIAKRRPDHELSYQDTTSDFLNLVHFKVPSGTLAPAALSSKSSIRESLFFGFWVPVRCFRRAQHKYLYME